MGDGRVLHPLNVRDVIYMAIAIHNARQHDELESKRVAHVAANQVSASARSSAMWRGRTGARCSIWWRQLVPEATTMVPKGWVRTRWASGSATLRESSYLLESAPKLPAIPQQPVSSKVARRPGRRWASRRMKAGFIIDLAWQ